MLPRILKTALCGALTGALAGVVAGGFCSVIFGQPFSGATGLKVFPGGMVFPGLFIVAPFTAGVGAILGAGIAWVRRGRTSSERDAPRQKKLS